MFIVNFNPTDKKCVFTQFLSVCYQIYYVIVVDLFSIFTIKFKRYYLFIYLYIGVCKKGRIDILLSEKFLLFFPVISSFLVVFFLDFWFNGQMSYIICTFVGK